ncbi:MAG TPA: universal stress protein [Puia sp.]|nr:universal stress protein [Puia sp.]
MKRILIATDLSSASDCAVEYGFRLASALDATVILVAAYEEVPIPVTDTMSMTVVDAPGVRALVEQGLQRQQALFQQDRLQPIETMAVHGPVVRSILDTVEELGADLIVVGMKGKGKRLRKLFGSTVTALARKTPVPLLVIPEEASYVPPANILLGNDIRPDTDIHVLDPMMELVATFASRVYALRVVKKGAKEFIEVIHPRNPLLEMNKIWEVKYEYRLGDDVVTALNEFVRQHNIQLAVMVPHAHSIPERWFLRGHTREMIFEATVPLLILPE